MLDLQYIFYFIHDMTIDENSFFPFCMQIYNYFSTIYWKKLSFVHWITFIPLSKISYPYVWVYFCSPVFIPVSHCLDLLQFVSLEVRLCQYSNVIVLFQSCLANLYLLHVQKRILKSAGQFIHKKPEGFMIEVVLNL